MRISTGRHASTPALRARLPPPARWPYPTGRASPRSSAETVPAQSSVMIPLQSLGSLKGEGADGFAGRGGLPRLILGFLVRPARSVILVGVLAKVGRRRRPPRGSLPRRAGQGTCPVSQLDDGTPRRDERPRAPRAHDGFRGCERARCRPPRARSLRDPDQVR